MLPLVVDAEAPALEALLARLAAPGWLDAALAEHGAVLLRGFACRDAADFERAVAAAAPTLRPYVEGQSDRERVRGQVYTSTRYPPEHDITLHNELSYTADPPARLFFFCEVAPDEGGETPLVDCARLYRALDPALVQRFVERGVRYLKTMHGGDGFGGKSWQAHFETGDRAAVERYLGEAGVGFAWLDDGSLRTEQRRPAVREHPAGTLWFNQVDLWHWSNLGARGETLRRMLGVEGLPTHATFGDGGELDVEDLAAIRAARWREASVFAWRAGDVLVVDNLRVAHGRRAFRGDRRVLIAMS